MNVGSNSARDALFEAVAEAGGELGAALFALEPGACMRRLPGRETFLVDLAEPLAPRAIDVEGDAAGCPVEARLPVVVKRFGASDGAEARAELLRGRLPRSPAQREAENLGGLLSAGLPVPLPYFWCESGAASLVLLEYVPHRTTLRRLLEAGTSEAEPFARELAGLVARMHAAGWYHRDLYLEHVLVSLEGELVLIDAGRARHRTRPRSRWFVKDLAALSSSAPESRDRARLQFAVRYFAAREDEAAGGSLAAAPGGRVAKRRFLARVERRAARMRSHIPRHAHQPAPPTTR